MRMKKWKKILIWVASLIVILGIGGLFAANYAVDKLISTLAADLENDLMEDATGISVTPDKSVDVQIDEDDNITPNTPEKNTNSDEGLTSETDKPDKGTQSTESSTNKTNNSKKNDGYTAEVSLDKAKDVQEKITVGEKAQVTGVLLKELSMADIKELQALAKGGLNQEEKKKARSIILDKLSAEQYDELIQVAKKYGMSQGKSYDEVSKEK